MPLGLFVLVLRWLGSRPILHFDCKLGSGLSKVAEVAGSFILMLVEICVDGVHARPNGVDEGTSFLLRHSVRCCAALNIIAYREVRIFGEIDELRRQWDGHRRLLVLEF